MKWVHHKVLEAVWPQFVYITPQIFARRLVAFVSSCIAHGGWHSETSLLARHWLRDLNARLFGCNTKAAHIRWRKRSVNISKLLVYSSASEWGGVCSRGKIFRRSDLCAFTESGIIWVWNHLSKQCGVGHPTHFPEFQPTAHGALARDNNH